MDSALTARGVTVRFGQRAVIRGVDFDAGYGEVVGVLGPNGAGKSSLLLAMAGLIPHEGEIRLSGRPLATYGRLERARTLAWVPQSSRLTVGLPVRAVVSQARYAHHGGLASFTEQDRRAVDEAMARMEVDGLADRPFTQLSGGEQRRVLLARALATEARCILLDEPTAALDIGHALAIYKHLREMVGAGRSVVCVLHNLDEARRFADRVYLLSDGAVVAAGPASQIVSEKPVERVYGVSLVEGGGLGFCLPEEGE